MLRQLLALHPIQLTLGELVREIAGGRGFRADRRGRTRRRRARRRRPVHRNGDVVLPSRAALRFDELLD